MSNSLLQWFYVRPYNADSSLCWRWQHAGQLRDCSCYKCQEFYMCLISNIYLNDSRDRFLLIFWGRKVVRFIQQLYKNCAKTILVIWLGNLKTNLRFFSSHSSDVRINSLLIFYKNMEGNFHE